MADMSADVQVSDEQRARVLEIVAADKAVGTVAALRQAGVEGSRGQLRRYVDDHPGFQEEIRLARGWNIVNVERTVWDVALNTNHQHWERAAGRLLKAYEERFRDASRLTVSGPNDGPLEVTHDVDAEIRKLLGELASDGEASAAGEVASAQVDL